MAVISSITSQSSVSSSPPVSNRSSLPMVQQQETSQSSNVHALPLKKEQPVTEKSVQQAVNQANQMLAASGSNETISFSYESKLNQLCVKIIDKNSGKIVREIPSKDFIRHQIALREMIGLILDKKA